MPGGNGNRDSRSVDYDPAVRAIMAQAIRAQRTRHGVLVWIASPARQFRDKDAGGRTAEERAFTRAAYWSVFGLPKKLGVPMVWSLKLTWGEQLVPSSHGRRARACLVRLYPRGQARVQPGRPSWVDEMQATGTSSFQPPRTARLGRPKPPPTIAS
jgi:hypothetical protein